MVFETARAIQKVLGVYIVLVCRVVRSLFSLCVAAQSAMLLRGEERKWVQVRLSPCALRPGGVVRFERRKLAG